MKIKVAKFGGSSVKDASALENCAAILERDPAIQLAILSATYKTTNQLEEISQFAAQGNSSAALEHANSLMGRHEEICADLELSPTILSELKTELLALAQGLSLLAEWNPKSMDRLYSLGERLSTTIFTHFLQQRWAQKRDIHFLAAGSVLKTQSDHMRATPLLEEIATRAEQELKPLLQNEKSLVITQGFLGETLDGHITTLGREGSDYSAALLAEAIKAEEILIFTDVPGIFSGDPNQIESPQLLEKISYELATTMACHGAKVLFPKTVLPAKRAGIPVRVLSSKEHGRPGTLIHESKVQPGVYALTLSDPLNKYTLEFRENTPLKEASKGLSEILWENNIAVEELQFVAGEAHFLSSPRFDLPPSAIRAMEQLGTCHIKEDLIKLSFIGSEIPKNHILIEKVTKVLDLTSIKIFDYSAHQNSLVFLVQGQVDKKTLNSLHQILIEGERV